jgi:hypothetical protein
MERLQWWLLLLSAVMFSMSGCSSVRAWQVGALRIWSENPAHFASAQHMAFSLKSHKTAASIKPGDTEAAEREAWWGREVPDQKAIVVASSGTTTIPASTSTTADDKGGPASTATPSTASTQTDPATTSAPASTSAPMHASAPAPTTSATTTFSAAAHPSVDNMDMTGVWRGRWTATGSWGERRESEAEMVFVQNGTRGTGRMRLADTVAATGVPETVRYFGALGTPMNYRVSRDQIYARYEDGPPVEVRFKRVGDRLYGRMAASPSFLLILERQ